MLTKRKSLPGSPCGPAFSTDYAVLSTLSNKTGYFIDSIILFRLSSVLKM